MTSMISDTLAEYRAPVFAKAGINRVHHIAINLTRPIRIPYYTTKSSASRWIGLPMAIGALPPN